MKLSDGSGVSFNKECSLITIHKEDDWTIHYVDRHKWKSKINGEYYDGDLPEEYTIEKAIETRNNIVSNYANLHTKIADNRPTLMVIPVVRHWEGTVSV
jgi:hypothetical protein